MTGPRVSVIMNCFNAARYVREAIDSVYSQTFPDWEIIFWDNASTDGSADIAKSYDTRLRYFRGHETVPLGRARNLALEQARGDYIGFLDCDDMWLPEKLARQVILFESDARVGLVYCNVYLFNAEGVIRPHFRGKAPPTGNIFSALLRDYFLPMPAIMIRRAMLARLDHWFDARFTVCEDPDLFIRLAHESDAAYAPEPLAKYRVHSESLTFRSFDQFPAELELMLEKFRLTIPDFESGHAREIAALRRRIAYLRSIGQLLRGNASESRTTIRPYRWSGVRELGLFLLSFLGTALFRRIWARNRNLS